MEEDIRYQLLAYTHTLTHTCKRRETDGDRDTERKRHRDRDTHRASQTDKTKRHTDREIAGVHAHIHIDKEVDYDCPLGFCRYL